MLTLKRHVTGAADGAPRLQPLPPALLRAAAGLLPRGPHAQDAAQYGVFAASAAAPPRPLCLDVFCDACFGGVGREGGQRGRDACRGSGGVWCSGTGYMTDELAAADPHIRCVRVDTTRRSGGAGGCVSARAVLSPPPSQVGVGSGDAVPAARDRTSCALAVRPRAASLPAAASGGASRPCCALRCRADRG
eukprot:COSAG01_NODE_326_length_18790_cov_10.366005_18_plen_191_part_00